MAKLQPQYNPDSLEAGCDEAGRGCLAGPVYAAAVILPPHYDNPLLNDSKQLTARKRKQLRDEIERDALAWAVGIVTNDEIDKINILHAAFLAMHRAIDQLKLRPQSLLIDGNRFDPYRPQDGDTLQPRPQPIPCKPNDPARLPHQCMVKGDARFQNIAAASILAKTYRDEYMETLAEQYPFYDWQSNKGYPTKAHREGIKKHGISPFHRHSFRLIEPEQTEIKWEE